MSFELPFKLPTGWQVATIDELVKQKIIAKPLDGNHGGIHPKASDYIESGVPFVMASDLAGGRVDLIDCKFISEEQASGLRKGIAKAGDVLLSHKATIGRTAIVQDSKHDFIMLTPQVTYYRVINSRALSNIYLKAYFDSRFFQSILGLWAGAGSTRAYLGITGQLKLPIILPPIEIQNEISGQVHALNKKVNLNNEINQTLEEMAQAIFKSWFVDFDPVKAKMNGEQPEGMDAATASLFPEKLVESELGLIPEGWDEYALYDIAEYINGAAYKKFEPNGEGLGLPIVKIAELKSGISDKTGFSTVQMPEKYRLDDKDILFSWSGNPDTSIDTFVWALGEAWLNQHIFKVVPKFGISRSYVLSLLKFMRPVFAEIARDKQTTGLGHVTVKDLQRLKVALPPEKLLIKFDEKVDVILAQNFNLVKQSQTLEKLRDTLLPKLLSGEIELTNAEEMAEVS